MTPKTIQDKSHRQCFSGTASCSPQGEFEILAITAGTGNGWEFTPEVLQESLPLWDQLQSFIDHSWSGRSVRDLAGICSRPVWDAKRNGIRLKLTPAGPSAQVLRDLGDEVNQSTPQLPEIGFSADLLFSAEGSRVTRIQRVFSVDLVVHPARGGVFLPSSGNPSPESNSIPTKEINLNEQPLQSSLPESPTAPAQDQQLKTCACLLETALSSANLPESVNRRLRSHFSDRVFDPEKLQQEISSARELVGELTGGTVVKGPGRISEMTSSEDQISAAVHDLLGAQRPEGLENIHPARLSGIRELYLRMTGDDAFSGGYDARRAQFAASADLPGVLKNAMNKLILTQWEELGRSGYRWWEPLVQVEHFNSLQEITGVLVGEVTVLPTVAEGAAYTELPVKDSAETGAWSKYGGYVGLTLEMFERDETHKLRQYPRKLASAALRRISALVGQVFTSNAGVGPVMADTYNVFDAVHHGNLGTTALGAAAWEAAGKAIYNQPMVVGTGGTAPKLALDARYLVVPRDLRLTGMNLLYPSFAHESSIFSENMQKGQMGDVITCPEFSDVSDWAAVADPRLAPGIIIAERFGLLPEIFIGDGETSGALFTNDELRMKVRHLVSVFVADHRPLYKANVA
ncbi:MAG: hypothetical protein ABFD24_09585 [Anaerolineaceae bacterium]